MAQDSLRAGQLGYPASQLGVEIGKVNNSLSVILLRSKLTYVENGQHHRAGSRAMAGRTFLVATTADGCGYYRPEFNLPGCSAV